MNDSICFNKSLFNLRYIFFSSNTTFYNDSSFTYIIPSLPSVTIWANNCLDFVTNNKHPLPCTPSTDLNGDRGGLFPPTLEDGTYCTATQLGKLAKQCESDTRAVPCRLRAQIFYSRERGCTRGTTMPAGVVTRRAFTGPTRVCTRRKGSRFNYQIIS